MKYKLNLVHVGYFATRLQNRSIDGLLHQLDAAGWECARKAGITPDYYTQVMILNDVPTLIITHMNHPKNRPATETSESFTVRDWYEFEEITDASMADVLCRMFGPTKLKKLLKALS